MTAPGGGAAGPWVRLSHTVLGGSTGGAAATVGGDSASSDADTQLTATNADKASTGRTRMNIRLIPLVECEAWKNSAAGTAST